MVRRRAVVLPTEKVVAVTGKEATRSASRRGADAGLRLHPIPRNPRYLADAFESHVA